MSYLENKINIENSYNDMEMILDKIRLTGEEKKEILNELDEVLSIAEKLNELNNND